MNQILLRSIKLNHAEFIPLSSQKLSSGSKNKKMQPGSQWLCTDPKYLGGFQLYIWICFLPILWHLQSLQQLLRTWLHFQASQDWGWKKRNFWFSPMLNAVVEQSPKCNYKQGGLLQHGILQHLYACGQTLESDQYYQKRETHLWRWHTREGNGESAWEERVLFMQTLTSMS